MRATILKVITDISPCTARSITKILKTYELDVDIYDVRMECTALVAAGLVEKDPRSLGIPRYRIKGTK